MSRKQQIPYLVDTLIKSANDTSIKVKNTVSDSLFEIGKHEYDLVLGKCHEYLDKEKINNEHVISLLNIIHRILQVKSEEVDPELCVKLIKQALNEMTKEKDVLAEWQGKASSILIDVAMRFPDKVIQAMLELCGPGVIPHYYVVKTFGDAAVANPVGVVPLLNEVFSRLVPVLASIKIDNMRLVFASTIGSFCEAICSYRIASPPDALDVSTYSASVYSCYELMLVQWLGSKEKRVRLTTIQSIGSTTMVMATASLEAQLPKLVPIFNGMYSKEKPPDYLSITQGYCNLLLVVIQGDSLATLLEPMREKILNTLFPLVCKTPDFTDSAQIKNHNEILRSIEILSRRWMDEVLTYLLQRLESKDPNTRNGSLVMIKHIVTRLPLKMEGKKEMVVTGLKNMVENEQDMGVKKSLAQLIASMANENYLILYGGEVLVEFIILTSAITDDEIKKWQAAMEKTKQKTAEPTSPSELRGMCDHILSLMTTTIPSMVDALWPYLLEPIVKPRFASAMAVVAKCIAHISEVKRQSQAANYMIDFAHTSNVNLPKPQEIMARLFVLSHLPFRRGSLALHLLKTLQHLGPMLHPKVSPLWDNTIPRMVDYLEKLTNSDNKTEAEVSKWEGLVRRLITETVKLVNDDNWTMEMSDAVLNQFPLFETDTGAKKVGYKMIGVLLSLISHKDYIKRTLDKIFNMVNHGNDDERVGLAQGYGFCSSAHLDIVLEQQTTEIKSTQPARKDVKTEKSGGGGGLFGGLFGDNKDKSSGPKGKTGNKVTTLLLAYGYITAYSKPTYITSRLEIHIITNMNPFFDTPDQKLQQVIIQTMDLIAQSVTPDHLQTAFIFKQRDPFLATLTSYLKLPVPKQAQQPAADKSKTDDKKKDPKALAPSNVSLETITINLMKIKIAVLALNACSDLISLDPGLPETVEHELVSTVAQYYSAQKEVPKEGKEAPKEEENQDGEEVATLDLIFLNLDRLLISVLTKDPTIACFKRLCHTITPFFLIPR